MIDRRTMYILCQPPVIHEFTATSIRHFQFSDEKSQITKLQYRFSNGNLLFNEKEKLRKIVQEQ